MKPIRLLPFRVEALRDPQGRAPPIYVEIHADGTAYFQRWHTKMFNGKPYQAKQLIRVQIVKR